MNSAVMCLFRFCCESSDSDDEEHPTSRTSLRHAVGPARMSRRIAPSEPASAAVAETSYHHTQPSGERNRPGAIETSIDDETCCQPGHDNSHVRGIQEFLRKLRENWRKYDSLEPDRNNIGPPEAGPNVPIEPCHLDEKQAALNNQTSPPLKTAQQFDSTRGVPAIHSEEVVMPGSLLQKEMAMSMDLEEHGDECVICMESFDSTNPRMPTLCGCGENKTFFHLPCLYQWIEQSRSCPSCRERLRWEEF